MQPGFSFKKSALAHLLVAAAVVLIPLGAHGQLADEKCKFLGNIIASSVPSDFGFYWNQVTPENAGKWGSVEPTRDQMNWTQLDLAYNYAKNNGLRFKQHTLVWGQQQPGWIDELSDEEKKAEVEEWIREFCERYPDTDYIDVVNEPLHALPSYMNALGGTGSTGWDWVIWTFGKAREYCPNAKLILNDYNIVSDNNATNYYVLLINLLKERGLIDIIGEQGHFLETTPLATIDANLDKLAATGLPIHISEFDVNIADDAEQRQKYQELFPVLWTHPAVQGVTLWGYRQGQIWRENAYLVRSDNTQRPAMEWLADYVPDTYGGSFCNPVSGIEDEAAFGGAYPNPTTGRFTLALVSGSSRVDVFDLQGRLVTRRDVKGQTEVQMHLDRGPGVYLLKVIRAQDSSWQRIIVK